MSKARSKAGTSPTKQQSHKHYLPLRATIQQPRQRKTTFYRWLMQFKKDNTPLGDLARDSSDDFDGLGIDQRGRCWDGTLADLGQILEDEGCAGAESTMEKARKLFLAYWRARRVA